MRLLSEYLSIDLENRASKYLSGKDMQFVYLISFLSTMGSLSVSEIYGWTPFTLSLVQRGFMYPIVIISAMSILKNNRKIYLISLLLAVPGSLVSLLHLITLRSNTLIGCGYSLPCATYSRIVIFNQTVVPTYLPLMALISFISITAIILLKQRNREVLIESAENISDVLWD